MKKKLEAELISIAHRILQGLDKSTLSQLQEDSRQVYEKLTILHFAESHFTGPQPTIGQVRATLENKEVEALQDIEKNVPQPIETPISKEYEENVSESIPLGENKKPTEERETIVTIEDKPELVIEDINARVTEDLFVPASSNTEVLHKIEEDQKPKSLNEQLRRDINIGLNDKLAFVKHLFEESTTDYNRVLSQLSTLHSKTEAQEFIETMVKPDYSNWEGKEEYETRFMDIVISKFEH